MFHVIFVNCVFEFLLDICVIAFYNSIITKVNHYWWGKEGKMKYYIIDDANGDMFETEINVSTMEDAVSIGKSDWSKLSRHDQDRRRSYEVVAVDGNVEPGSDAFYDSICDVYKIK